MKWQQGFWAQRRPARAALKDPHQQRADDNLFAISQARPHPGVNYEVEHFRIYGNLRRAKTEVKDVLPDHVTIEAEKAMMVFDDQKKTKPDSANYKEFYRTITDSIASTPDLVSPAKRAPFATARSLLQWPLHKTPLSEKTRPTRTPKSRVGCLRLPPAIVPPTTPTTPAIRKGRPIRREITT